jgi:hypothetical protein
MDVRTVHSRPLERASRVVASTCVRSDPSVRVGIGYQIGYRYGEQGDSGGGI